MRYTFIISIIIAAGIMNSCRPNYEVPKNGFIIADSVMSFFPHLQDSSNQDFGELVAASLKADRMDKPYIPSEFEVAYISLIYEYDDFQDYLDRKNKLISSSIRSIKPWEKEFNIISSEEFLMKLYSINELDSIYRMKNELFLINFREVYRYEPPFKFNSGTNCGLPTDFDIYVQEHGFVNVIEESYDYNWSLLPTSIKRGYSSGISVNDSMKIIIYWVVAW